MVFVKWSQETYGRILILFILDHMIEKINIDEGSLLSIKQNNNNNS